MRRAEKSIFLHAKVSVRVWRNKLFIRYMHEKYLKSVATPSFVARTDLGDRMSRSTPGDRDLRHSPFLFSTSLRNKTTTRITVEISLTAFFQRSLYRFCFRVEAGNDQKSEKSAVTAQRNHDVFFFRFFYYGFFFDTKFWLDCKFCPEISQRARKKIKIVGSDLIRKWNLGRSLNILHMDEVQGYEIYTVAHQCLYIVSSLARSWDIIIMIFRHGTSTTLNTDRYQKSS